MSVLGADNTHGDSRSGWCLTRVAIRVTNPDGTTTLETQHQPTRPRTLPIRGLQMPLPSGRRTAVTFTLDDLLAQFAAGYDTGYAHGRNDRHEDDRQAAVHDLACRTNGLRPPDDDGPPLWAIEP